MKLHNTDISEKHQDTTFNLMQSDFMGAFAYWVVVQSPYPTPDITEPLKGFYRYISEKIAENDVKQMKQSDIWDIINEDVFESIPEIEKLNHAKIEQEGFINSGFMVEGEEENIKALNMWVQGISNKESQND